MLGKSPYVLSAALSLLLSSCTPQKEADIVGAAVIAELAQSRNVRPSEIVVERVTFSGRHAARVEAAQLEAGSRLPHSVTFACEAQWSGKRWTVNCKEQPIQ